MHRKPTVKDNYAVKDNYHLWEKSYKTWCRIGGSHTLADGEHISVQTLHQHSRKETCASCDNLSKIDVVE